MIKGILIGAFLTLICATNAHAGNVTIRGLVIGVPTENSVFIEYYKDGLDALFESCPEIMHYRQDIDHYGIYANIDVYPWNIDSKNFNYFHYRGKPKSGKSPLEQIAERFGWHGGIWVTIITIDKPKSAILRSATSAFNAIKGHSLSINFQIGGGKHPGIVMQKKYKPFCNPAHSVVVKMPDARKDWADPESLIFIPNDDASSLSVLF